MVAFALIFSLSSVIVADEVDPKVIVTQENLFETIDPYVVVDESGFFTLDIDDDNIIISPKLYKTVLLSLNMTNEKIENDEVEVTENGSIYEVGDDYLYVQGGINKSTWHWWGKKMWMTTWKSNQFIHELDQIFWIVTCGGTVASAVTAGVCVPIGVCVAAGFAIAATTVKLIYNDAKYKNSIQSNGLIVNWTYCLYGTTVRTQ